MSNKLRVWRLFLVVVWVLTLTHFLKDITQDILRIPTVLDVFGDIKEDVDWLPTGLKWMVYGAGIGSVLAEIFLLIAIPRVWHKGKRVILEKWVVGVVLFMLIYFPVVIFLDPRFGG